MIGLGNPGPRYAGNRHNVGKMVTDELARRTADRFSSASRVQADVVETRLGPPPGVRVVLAEPRTYMNTAGGPVAGLVRFFRIEPSHLVVIHDELDLPYLGLRLKFGGGDNGHNGLRSVRSSLGSGDFHRVRFGIGRPPGRQDPAEFVLRDFTAAERNDLACGIDRATDAVERLLLAGLVAAQNEFNR